MCGFGFCVVVFVCFFNGGTLSFFKIIPFFWLGARI